MTLLLGNLPPLEAQIADTPLVVLLVLLGAGDDADQVGRDLLTCERLEQLADSLLWLVEARSETDLI